MPRTQEQYLREQISDSFQRSTEQIDREVGQALGTTNEYHHHYAAHELVYVFANVFHTLIDVKYAGLSSRLTHNVALMEVEVTHPRVSVNSILHIHSPIRAFLEIGYALENHAAIPGVLTLVKNSLRVQERVGRLDLVARAALRTMDVRGEIECELQDPAQIIRKTLPHRLKNYGFAGEIEGVWLDITPDNLLDTLLTGRPAD